MESAENITLYIQDQMYEFFEKNISPMFLFHTVSKKAVAYNHVFLNNAAHYKHFIPLWVVKYRQSSRVNTLVEYKGDRIQFLSSDLGEDLLLIQMVEISVSLINEIEALAQPDIVDKKENHKNSGVFFKKGFESTFSRMCENAPIGIVFTDVDFTILWSNEKCNQLFGRSNLYQTNFADAIFVNNIADFWSKIEKSKKSDASLNFSFSIKNIKSGKDIFVRCTALGTRNESGTTDGFIFLLEDDTEKTNFSQEIKVRSLELNQINHELDKFLYSVSHNIRGPIASLEGLLKVIEISDLNAVNQLKHHLRLNLRLLNSFVQDINNVATNIHTHVKHKEINLYNMIDELLLFMDSIYEINAVKRINIPYDYTLISDSDRLAIVLKGVLKNSYQYKDLGKNELVIEVNVSKNEDFHLIEIIDNGIGIKDEIKPRIFDMFYRGTELSTGNGMGLHNTREILKKIGGTMNIESRDRLWTKVKMYLPVNPN